MAGYKIAPDQQSLTQLQRLFLLYGYAHHQAGASTTAEAKETRPLTDLVHILPKAKGDASK